MNDHSFIHIYLFILLFEVFDLHFFFFIKLYEKIEINRENNGFTAWIDFFKSAFSITSIKTNELQKLLNPLENMAKLLLSASIEGNYDFVAGGATIFWNLIFPKLREAPQRAEIIRIFEIVHKSLLKTSKDVEQLLNCFENEISLYYGALASFKGVTSEETEITNGRL